ncbi:MAG: hypothetical protein J6X11_02945 [Treponema sp.]|nr:hypothetical protein [Treponema sp.]
MIRRSFNALKILLIFLALAFVSCSAYRKFCGTWIAAENWMQYGIQIEISKDGKVVLSYFPNESFLYADEASESIVIPDTKEGYLDKEKMELVFDTPTEKTIMCITFCYRDSDVGEMTIVFEDGSLCDFIRKK